MSGMEPDQSDAWMPCFVIVAAVFAVGVIAVLALTCGR